MLGISIIAGLALSAGVTYKYYSGKNTALKNNVILTRYSMLISLLTEKREAQINHLRNTSVLLKITLGKDQHFFNLTEVDGRLILVWKLQSSVHGTRGKEWSFNPDYDQKKMYQEIISDLRNYQASFKTKNPYTDRSFLTAV